MSRVVRNLTEGPIVSALVRLAVPIVFANLLQTAYQLIDTFWVGRLGAAAVAAVPPADARSNARGPGIRATGPGGGGHEALKDQHCRVERLREEIDKLKLRTRIAVKSKELAHVNADNHIRAVREAKQHALESLWSEVEEKEAARWSSMSPNRSAR